MKTYEMYVVVRISEEGTLSAPLDQVEKDLREAVAKAGYKVDDVFVEDALEE